MNGLFVLGALLSQAGSECSSLLREGQRFYESRLYPAAAAEFEKAAAVCARQDEALLGLGQSLLLDQRFDASIAAFNRLLASRPRDAAALKLKADALYLSGRESEAEQALVLAREAAPGNMSVLYSLGRIYYQQSRYSEAAASFQHVIEREPANFRAHDNLALTYEALHQDDAARKHYLRALDLVYKDHPDYDWAYANFADFLLRREENSKAFQLAVEASKRNPRSARNLFLTGKALAKLGKDDQSVRWLEQSIKADPKYPEPRYLLSQVYRRLGRADESKRELEEFRRLSTLPRTRR